MYIIKRVIILKSFIRNREMCFNISSLIEFWRIPDVFVGFIFQD